MIFSDRGHSPRKAYSGKIRVLGKLCSVAPQCEPKELQRLNVLDVLLEGVKVVREQAKFNHSFSRATMATATHPSPQESGERHEDPDR